MPCQILQQLAEIADDLAAGCQQRKTLGDRRQDRLCIGRLVQQRAEIEDLARLQAGAFDVQLVDRLGEVGDGSEIQTDRRAASGRLWLAGGAQIFMASAVSASSDSRRSRSSEGAIASSSAPPMRAGDKAREQFPESLEFQDAGAGGLHFFLYCRRSRKPFSMTASVPSVIQ